MADKKIIAVTGATGAQAGGLARAILDDPSGEFALRAVTRDPGKDAARALADRGAEVVQADLDDEASLRSAFDGAYGAYCLTNFWEHFNGEMETAQGGNLARAAATAASSTPSGRPSRTRASLSRSTTTGCRRSRRQYVGDPIFTNNSRLIPVRRNGEVCHAQDHQLNSEEKFGGVPMARLASLLWMAMRSCLSAPSIGSAVMKLLADTRGGPCASNGWRRSEVGLTG